MEKDSVNILFMETYSKIRKVSNPTLWKLPFNRKLDLLVLSHIDNDHLICLSDLLENRTAKILKISYDPKELIVKSFI